MYFKVLKSGFRVEECRLGRADTLYRNWTLSDMPDIRAYFDPATRRLTHMRLDYVGPLDPVSTEAVQILGIWIGQPAGEVLDACEAIGQVSVGDGGVLGGASYRWDWDGMTFEVITQTSGAYSYVARIDLNQVDAVQ